MTSSALMSLLVVVTSLLVLTAGRQVCHHCDCHISSAENGVKAVYSMSLVCNAGTITWHDADGGVRLELSPFVHTHFRACFMADALNTRVRISQETQVKASPPASSLPASYSPRHAHQAKRLKEEEELRWAGENSVGEFHLDHVMTSSSKSKEFCIEAGPGRPLHLFLETSRPATGVYGAPKVKFHYDVTKLSPETPQDPIDECRPCSREEILDAYCTMDFVVVGQMTAMAGNEATGRSEISVAAKQVIHQREPHFFKRVNRSDPHLTGTVNVSSNCGLRPSDSVMLLTGRLRLDSLALTCVAYMHEWRKIQHDVECTR